MAEITGIHLLLTYKCIWRCDHCFVWSGPDAEGVMTLRDIESLLGQSKDLRTVETICFEGGEPFLYYPILLEGVRKAKELGFKISVVTDCYWVTNADDARKWLEPMADIGIDDFSVSGDVYHGEAVETEEVRSSVRAAKALGLPVSILAVEKPGEKGPATVEGISVSYTELMYRGRCISKLVGDAAKKPWSELKECPHEDLENQKRVHIDPFGWVHVCQGIAIGNAWQQPLHRIMGVYDPRSYPVVAPLLRGGPVELAKEFDLSHEDTYADACHFCYDLRVALRERFPEILAPDQMYGVGVD